MFGGNVTCDEPSHGRSSIDRVWTARGYTALADRPPPEPGPNPYPLRRHPASPSHSVLLSIIAEPITSPGRKHVAVLACREPYPLLSILQISRMLIRAVSY